MGPKAELAAMKLGPELGRTVAAGPGPAGHSDGRARVAAVNLGPELEL